MRFPLRNAGRQRDEQTVADWVRREQPDVIVHTAALSDTGYSEKHPDESYRANVLVAALDV